MKALAAREVSVTVLGNRGPVSPAKPRIPRREEEDDMEGVTMERCLSPQQIARILAVTAPTARALPLPWIRLATSKGGGKKPRLRCPEEAFRRWYEAQQGLQGAAGIAGVK